jgi:hypothetical protein
MTTIPFSKYFLLLLTIPFLFSACEKEDKRLPILLTYEAKDISRSRAVVSGKLVIEFTKSVTELGFCWDENPNPGLSSNSLTIQDYSVGEDFEVDITGLKPNTTYYLRTYAKAGSDLSFGDEVSFTTTNLPISTPCQPEDNLLIINSEEHRYSKVYHPYSGGNGGYTFYVGGSRSDIYISFQQKPETGKYITQNYSTSYWQPNGCKIRATLFNQVCYTIEDNFVFVDNDGNGNFIITFCDNYFSYSTSVFFPFRGRLVTN